MNSINRHNAKMLAAVIGGSALVTFGAISVGIAQNSASQDNVASSEATINATTAPATTTTAALAVMGGDKFAPTMTGKAAEQPGEQPNRIP